MGGHGFLESLEIVYLDEDGSPGSTLAGGPGGCHDGSGVRHIAATWRRSHPGARVVEVWLVRHDGRGRWDDACALTNQEKPCWRRDD